MDRLRAFLPNLVSGQGLLALDGEDAQNRVAEVIFPSVFLFALRAGSARLIDGAIGTVVAIPTVAIPTDLHPRFPMLSRPRIQRVGRISYGIIAGLLGAPTIIIVIALIWGGVFSW